VLNLSSTPNRKQSPLAVVLWLCTAAPKSIVKSVDFYNSGEGELLIISFGFTKA